MPVTKGGVWTNIEDEILKAAVSKYGLNQWARVSSLLARKTPKQCKARWSEWLDPGIRKIEWSKEEDEKLLHLAKLMPTQWRTIAPIVGRTATQCLERYQKLLDDAESRENDELGLGGPEGGENKAPSADDVRRLRPGEMDTDPESKPARPDTIDLDEDEKEMLSEARARLANTQGKKAKRKARERQLEESRRLAQLQKRRELKAAGINIKITTRKPGQMDYNADIPFEKAPAQGFHDTRDEQSSNERARDSFDPRKQNLSNKRKSDQDNEIEERKRRKSDKKNDNQAQSATQAAMKAAQMQRKREAERSGKRQPLTLPAPQVDDSEVEDIVKIGLIRETRGDDFGSDATRGLVSDYSSNVASTPLRTPRAPQGEDRIANEIRNARARTETQSALLGEDNPELHEGEGTTGYGGAAPSKNQLATPNPLATPFRQGQGTPGGVGATPMRTPRDNFRLNDQTPQQPGQTPRDIRLAREAAKGALKSRLGALGDDGDVDVEFDVPDFQSEITNSTGQGITEDSAIRDAREAEIKAARTQAEFKRQTQVLQRGLPRPRLVDLDALLRSAKAIGDPAQSLIAQEAALLIAHDARKLGGATVTGEPKRLDRFTDEQLEKARMEIALELSISGKTGDDKPVSITKPLIEDPSLESELPKLYAAAEQKLTDTALAANATEKKLGKLLGGYQARSKVLRQKIVQADEALHIERTQLETMRLAIISEDAGTATRLDRLRDEVQHIMRRERNAQDLYRQAKDELTELEDGAQVDGNL